MNRRRFLAATLAASTARAPFLLAAQSAPAMKVTRVETVYWKDRNLPWWPHWVWVRVVTDTGQEGIGETYPRNDVEAAAVHSGAARMLLGKDPRDIDRIWADLYRTFDYQVTGGAEMRALSAPSISPCGTCSANPSTPPSIA